MTQINATLRVWTPGGWVEPPYGADLARDLKMFNVRGPHGWKIRGHRSYERTDATLAAWRPDWEGGDYWLDHDVSLTPRPEWMRLMFLEDRTDPRWRIEEVDRAWGGYALHVYNSATGEDATGIVSYPGGGDLGGAYVGPWTGALMHFGRSGWIDPDTSSVVHSYNFQRTTGLFDVFSYTQMLQDIAPHMTFRGLGVYPHLSTMGLTRVEVRLRLDLRVHVDNGPWSPMLSEPTYQWSVFPADVGNVILAGHAWSARAPNGVPGWPYGFLVAADGPLAGPMVPDSPGSTSYGYSKSAGYVWAINGLVDTITFGAYVANVPSVDDFIADKGDVIANFSAAAETVVVGLRLHYAQDGYATPESTWLAEGPVE